MPKYEVYYFYRDTEIEPGADLTKNESWDGQKRIEVETDLAFGDSDGDVTDELQDVLRRIGLANGHQAVSPFRIREILEENDPGASFFQEESLS